MVKKRILVTSALPYANGSIHIGHLVEYIQTDVFVRFLRLRGEDVIYCCADDTHGTPIEINAAKQGVSPEEFIARYHKEHTADFSKYHIEFDSYYSTNSPENKEYVGLIFDRLKKKGHIYQKELELTYCESCKRFLPDRYVKGKCPKCGAPDQYGDVCESCNTAYKTTDLVEPYCSICHKTPIRKLSNHYFFKLSAFSDKLREWLTGNDKLQPEVRNQVLSWIDKGLEDWNISRDGPYFGFKIPGEDDKYFYVWLDAPIGYIASTANCCRDRDVSADDYWQKDGSQIIHFIGKDIIYFHLLFWPAVLMGADFNLPDYLVVHGFLTVNKEKMSKSRGTFLNASDFEKLAKPELLRYYYAANLTHKMVDVDLDLNDFRERVNNELVANIANFVYRVLSFCNNNFDSKIVAAEPFERDFSRILDDYANVEFRSVVKQILALSSEGNRYFQDSAPWALVKEDKQKAQQVVSNCVNLVKDLVILLKPILPVFAESVERQLNLEGLDIGKLGENIGEHTIGKAEILLTKIDKIELKAERAFPLDLRVAEIKKAEAHPEADKLLVLGIDIGEERTIVAGLKGHYSPEELVGKRIVVVKNLKPAVLRGVESRGMLLAADFNGPKLLTASGAPGDKVWPDGVDPKPKKQVTIDEFASFQMVAENEKASYDGHVLKTEKGDVLVEGVKKRSKIR
jgi:methionyl-tRNA synthetase